MQNVQTKRNQKLKNYWLHKEMKTICFFCQQIGFIIIRENEFFRVRRSLSFNLYLSILSKEMRIKAHNFSKEINRSFSNDHENNNGKHFLLAFFLQHVLSRVFVIFSTKKHIKRVFGNYSINTHISSQPLRLMTKRMGKKKEHKQK